MACLIAKVVAADLVKAVVKAAVQVVVLVVAPENLGELVEPTVV